MKRYLIVLGVLTLVLLNVNIVFAYTDTEGHWAEQDIKVMSFNGIISGYSDGSFKPNNYLTRAELVTIINRILNNTKESKRYIPDISPQNWYYNEIRKGVSSGFIQGNRDNYVRPNDYITREETVAMLQRAFVALKDVILSYSYEDYDDVSNWAKDAMYTFINNGYISGYNDFTIRPKANITRAEVVKIISRIGNEFVSYGKLSGNYHGNIFINGDKVKLDEFTLYGNLIICEGATNLSLNNVKIDGDLIVRTVIEKPLEGFSVTGKTVEIIKDLSKDEQKYQNDEYGISFSIPIGAKVVYLKDESQPINNKQKNLIVIRINQNDELIFTSFEDGLLREKNRFALPYKDIKKGAINYYKYAVCGSEKDNSYFIYIKRDDVEYSIYFYNADHTNIIDALVDSIELFDGLLIKPHERKTYNNPNLFLKFGYIDYVAVDDSYNTGIVNEEESFYKMIIQVTNIIDMSNYTIEQLKTILVGLEDTQSEMIESKITKVYTYDAVEYTIKNDGKLSKSLYIVISNKLYHFIFTSDEEKMKSAGFEIYKDIINNIEF